MLAPTVRDPDRRTSAFEALAPTISSSGATAPGGTAAPQPMEWPSQLRSLNFVQWLRAAGTGEVERVALAHRGWLPAPIAGLFAQKNVVVKFYRSGLAPREGVWQAWQQLDHARVVKLLESGTVDGRAYEVMPDVGDPLGDDPASRRLTLRDVLLSRSGGLSESVVTDLVRQLAEAIDALGTAGLAHLDLRPENVLARRRRPGPTGGPEQPAREDTEPGWDLTVIDFGISAVVTGAGVDRIDRATTAYSAPDVLSGSASLASDYWSLGIMVAELATGSHPFFGLDEWTIQKLLSDNNAPAPDGLPTRLAQLYDGLATREPDRWGADEVRDWLAGETIPPSPERETNPKTPFRFQNEDYLHPFTLATALQANWSEAADVLTGPIADRWDELLGWLKQFDRPGRNAAHALRVVRSWGPDHDPASPDARLLVLLCWMAPALADRRYRRVRIDLQRLPKIALASLPVTDEPPDASWADLEDFEDRGSAGSSMAREVVEDLWRWPLLTELDQATGFRAATVVDRVWHDLDRRWHSMLRVVDATGSPLAEYPHRLQGTSLHAHLLRIAASEHYVAYLRDDLEATRRFIDVHLGGSYPDYEEFVATVLPAGVRGGSPDIWVGLLAAHRLHGFVMQRAELEVERRAAIARTAWARDLAWRRRERWRLLDRPAALGWATAAMAVLGLAWAAVFILDESLPRSWIFVPHPGTSALTMAWGVVGVCVGAQTAVEVWLAALIGAPYHRGYSAASALIRVGGSAGERFGGSYVGAAFVAVVLAGAALGLLALVFAAPYLLPVPIVVAHLWWARRRFLRWRADHEALRAQFAEPAFT